MSLSDNQRLHIIEVAKSWVNTPYRGHSCLKGAGVDCGQLLKGVYIEAGHQFPDGIPLRSDYSLQVSQHKHDTEYIDIISKYMREVPESEVKPGDIVVYKMDLAFAHAAFVIDWPHFIIHAINDPGVCGGHGMNNKFGKLSKRFYSLRDEFIGEE
jgi:hypothetical protein